MGVNRRPEQLAAHHAVALRNYVWSHWNDVLGELKHCETVTRCWGRGLSPCANLTQPGFCVSGAGATTLVTQIYPRTQIVVAALEQLGPGFLTCKFLNRGRSFCPLPMASGKSETNHILLAVASPLAKFLDALAESFEKFDVIYHAATFYFCLTRNTTSRLAASAPWCRCFFSSVAGRRFVIVGSLDSMAS